jgi:hypothetical protein
MQHRLQRQQVSGTLMGSSSSKREWNENCAAVKAANGDYPEFWFKEVIMSGLASQTAAKFKL